MQLTRALCDFFCCNSFSIVVLLVILKLEHPNIYIIHATISSPFIYLFFEYFKDVWTWVHIAHGCNNKRAHTKPTHSPYDVEHSGSYIMWVCSVCANFHFTNLHVVVDGVIVL